jgi:hypothetical protein
MWEPEANLTGAKEYWKSTGRRNAGGREWHLGGSTSGAEKEADAGRDGWEMCATDGIFSFKGVFFLRVGTPRYN